ncbi:MAG TPA: hypothetical protein VK826_00465 [Bacteroidia bacterium]|nr:hypothetical protein [Bacteroidia bacterium]
MKQVFAFAILFVWMCSCNDEPKTSQTDADTGTVQVPATGTTKDTVARIAANVTDTVVTPIDSTYTVELTIYFTRNYCGGARPSEEMLADLQTPRLLTKSILRLKNHHSQKEYTCKTNGSGKADLTLEAGKYDVYLTKDINSALNTGFYPDCKIWQEKPLFTIKVTPDRKSFSATINFECNPCNPNKPM